MRNSFATPTTFEANDYHDQSETMSTVLRPRFFSQPLKYLQWAAIEKPAIFFSIVIGSLGPATLVVAPPIRRAFGDGQRPPIPLTYPIPAGPRKPLEGYDDE